MGERKRRAAAGYVPAPYLTDRERMELAIPAALIAALAFANVFGADPTAEDRAAALAEVERTSKRLQNLLIASLEEPFADLRITQRRRPMRATKDLCADAVRAMGFEDQSSLKFGMVFYYWLEDLLSRDVICLAEGSAMAEAMGILMPMLEEGFERELQDASARKQAARLLRFFQGRGFYVEAVAIAAEPVAA